MSNLAKLPLQTAKRSLTAAQQTAQLAMAGPDASACAEVMDLQRAAFDRAVALQQSWAQAWADWADYAMELPEADTMPKFSDRAGNIWLQAQNQLTAQITDMAELSENVAVSYSYWVAQQVQKAGGNDG